MKKIIYFIGIVSISLILFSCKSTKQEELLGDGSETVVEESAEKEENPKEKKKKEKKSKKEEKKEEEEEEKTSDHDNYLGWIGSSVRNPIYEDGLVKIKTDSGLGTFCFFAVDEDGKPTPVFSTLNEYSSTGFQLKAGRKVYKLISSKNVKSSVGLLSNGIGLFYDIKNVANVAVNMEAMPSVNKNLADTVKITVEVRNTGKKVETYSIKAILDTVLGEQASFHFYKPDDMPVKREYALRSFRDESWFVSKNDSASMQILLYGGDITPPSLLALANYDTLENAYWEPNMLSERAFDTVLSYNNSAIGVIWPEVRLEPGKSSKIRFYISLGLYGKTPTGHYLVNGIKPPAKPVEKEPVPVLPQPEEKVQPVIETPVIENPIVETPVVEEPEVPEEIYNEEIISNVEFNLKKIPKDHLTNEYVQSLINRIDELEQSGEPIDPNEILKLKAEIDAILSILRQ